EIASFVCALTALSVAANRFVAVGSACGGYIVLPPHATWGLGAPLATPWAERELRVNLARVADAFPDAEAAVDADGGRWGPACRRSTCSTATRSSSAPTTPSATSRPPTGPRRRRCSS